MKTLALIPLFFLLVLPVGAQTAAELQPADTLSFVTQLADTAAALSQLSLVRRVVRGFDRLEEDYIEPQHYVFTVMLQATRAYDLYTLSSSESEKQRITFSPDRRVRVGPYVGWKWIFLGYTFDLSNINLNDLTQEFCLSIYSSQIGVDLFYRRTGNDYMLRDARLGSGVNASALEGVSFDGLQAGITGFNLYYIFNHGRFSYPAAFAQSTQQKISCGSWMAGLGYTRNSIELDYRRLQQLVDERLGDRTVQLDSGLMFNSIKYYDYSLSAGYAYNWVFARNWLFGASLQAALGYKNSVGDIEVDEVQGFSFSNLNIDGIGRFGLVYNNSRWYAGASAVLHTYNYRKSRFSTNNTFGSMSVYVGFNFGLKKKYRKQCTE